jgi:2,4-dienoyl-CoA reductase-like NADH-dependent reductase (Old Yellow Enzyme family)/thioredoxin reductase
MNPYYPNLFSPIKIGNVTLKNRIISAPSSQADINRDGTLNPYNIAYYARKAKGGCSLVTIGDGIVHPTGQDHPRQVFLYTDDCLPSLMRCAEEIHRYDCLASYELSHGGITCDPAFIGGRRPLGPSEVPVTIGFQTDHQVETMSEALTEEMMIEIADSYASAAARVKKAGFDMVMVHGAHGWLIGQFFSPNINHRTDEYGGSIENRCRFAIMVLKKIREAVGPGFPIDFRMNGEDGIDGGLELEEAIEIAKMIEPYVDSFHISSSVHYVASTQDIMQSPMFQPRGHMLHLAAAIKQAVKVPVTTVGGHAELDVMEEIVATDKADIVALGRQLLADPDIAIKGQLGRSDEVRTCLRCGLCQSYRFTRGAARCAINPEMGREYEVQFYQPPKGKKKVLIAGGGPAGMQAAITASELGHDVTLYEAKDHLGGALCYEKDVSFKVDLYKLAQVMEAELRNTSAKVILNTPLTVEIAKAEKPDVILYAIGAESIRPPIPGVDGENVMLATEQKAPSELGQKIVVVGGGLIGCETALHLAEYGKDITILEMTDTIAADANFRHIRTVNSEIENRGIKLALNTKCSSITDKGVYGLDADNNEVFFPADSVIISVGMRPLAELGEPFRYIAPIYRPIGNCVKAGQVKEAIRAGYDAAITLA